MKLRSFFLIGAAAAALALPAAAFAQTATPMPTQPMNQVLPPTGFDYVALMADAPTIAIGETVTGELGGDVQATAFVFTGEAGQQITATLISDAFDCYLVLVDAEGNELDVDDDSAGSLDSRIAGFTLPADGTYGLIVTSFSGYRGSGTAQGEFTLSLETFEARTIEYGQRIEDALTMGATSLQYRFTGTAGDTVTIFMGSEEFDTYLYLYDRDGFELTYNDDGGGNLDSLIGPYQLPYTGEYIIEANSFSRSATGSFFLTLNRIEMIEIAYGDEVETTIRGTGELYFQFEAQMGDIVSVIVDADVDTSLTLRDPYGYSVLSDEDSGSRFNPEITNYLVNSAGTYSLVLTSVGGESGTVRLTLERGELPSLDDGPQTVSFDEVMTTRSLTFTAEQGVEYTLTFQVQDGVASPSFELRIGEFGYSYYSANNVTGGSVSFVAETSGSAVITVNEYSYRNSHIVVSLTANE
jgi:hypothetical protein